MKTVAGVDEARDAARTLLDNEQTRAWTEYLEACRHDPDRYDEVEPWAWTRLRQRLRSIQTRLARLEP